jgi:hypothetical protein
MPVTVRPSDRKAESWACRGTDSRFTHVTSPEQLLSTTISNDGDLVNKTAESRQKEQTVKKSMIQSSFADVDRESSLFATKNGLVHACIEAYNEHHKLVIRPDDVWLAILTQLSVHINADAERLRKLFFDDDNKGQKRELHIDVQLEGLDHGRMAFMMTKLMGESMRDPTLRSWILPAFSTTEKTDEAVASIVFMGAMQKYFTYSWGTRCGIPEVTLLGEASDWVEIARRCADRLGSGAFGEEAKRWYRVLRPVVEGFVETFRDPKGQAAQTFWKGICDKHVPNGSGSVTYSGWITAFCYWDEKGNCLHGRAYGPGCNGPRLSRSEIPMGFSKVPVTLLDDGVPIATEMVAGSVAIRLRRSADVTSPSARSSKWHGFDTVQPESGWFMYKT